MRKSNSENATTKRIEVIDFLRGLAIFQMIIFHYPQFYPLVVEKLFHYAETGLPIFLLLAGFMIGYHYFPRYLRDRRKTTRQLWSRAVKILAIHYIIIATVNTSLYLIGHGSIDRSEPLWLFLLKSAAFMNQIGIIHILPTFIPLFIVSPFILFLFKAKLDWLIYVLSAAIFALGNFSPYLFDLGEPTIFPAIVFQVYFVAGCAWGKAAYNSGSLAPRGLNGWLIASCAGLVTTMSLMHGKIIPGHLVSTHPLNIFGLIYKAPIITTTVLGAMRFWRAIKASPFYSPICLYGRHALLAFAVHVYWAKAVTMLNFFFAVPMVINYLLILANIGVGLLVLNRYEKHDRTQPARWVQTLDALFK